MASWYVDKGLGTLINQVRQRYPGTVVGTIGDTEHQTGTSDHNPESDGSVDAADFMVGGPFTQVAAQQLADLLVRWRDPRISYLIWNRRICSSTISPWTWRPYTGVDPHTGHLHLSVNDLHENDTSPWKLWARTYVMQPLAGYALPVLKYGDDDAVQDGYDMVSRAQRLLKVIADGRYGDQTTAAVKALGFGDGRTIDLAVWVKLYGLTRATAGVKP